MGGGGGKRHDCCLSDCFRAADKYWCSFSVKSGKEHIGWAVVPENSLKVLQLSKVIFCVC